MTTAPGETADSSQTAAARPRRTIARDLAVGLTVVVAAVTMVIVSLTYLVLSHRAKVQIEQMTEEYLEHLLDSLEVPIWNLDEQTIKKTAQAYMNNELVAKLRVTHSGGIPIFERIAAAADDLIERTRDVTHQGQVIGRVEIGITSTPAKRSNRQLLWSSILLAFVTVAAVTGATALLLQKFLRNPLDQLLAGIERMAKGDYDENLPESRHKEIQAIISRFNHMSQQVRSRENSLVEMNRQLQGEIAERKRVEEELAKHREHLEELVEERSRELEAAQQELVKRERLAVLGQLTATVSHELRNPLGVIRSSAFYLRRRLPDADEKVAKHLARIDEQVSICDAIVGDLLEYTRGRHSEKVTGQINSWLQELLGEFAGLAEVDFVLRLDPDLAPFPFDREKMRRAVVNLATNAVQAVTAQKEAAALEGFSYKPRITISTSREQDHVVIQVEDNGIGMNEETVKHAFEPLFTTRARGTGLGLAIVERIASEHDGMVSLQSRPGEGTSIRIALPLCQKP